MRAVVIGPDQDPDSLHIVDVPDPEPAADEVLIQVTAAGVNRADLLQRQGFYPPPPGASEILGLECSGVITEVGARVSGWQVGDRVCALLSGGGYAEYVAVPAGQVMPVPDGIDVVTAAGLPEVACTVYSNLTLTGRLGEGEWLLVHGGGSGIGTFAIQWARELGAHVAVTVGGETKRQLCTELGAEVVIDYREQDFVEEIKTATGRRGADVILDIIGAKYLDRNISALAPDGRLVIIGLQGGVRAELSLNRLLQKRATIAATSLRSLPAERKAAICTAVVERMWPLVAAGRMRPVIDEVLPMNEAGRAHLRLADGGVAGKLLLRWD